MGDKEMVLEVLKSSLFQFFPVYLVMFNTGCVPCPVQGSVDLINVKVGSLLKGALFWLSDFVGVHDFSWV